MKDNKDISKNMKDNQHKLNKKPSDKAWNKLEEQLNDFQPKAKRRKLIAKWSIAASILAIVGIGALVSNNLKTHNTQTAMNAPMKMTFEELGHVDVPIAKKEIVESYRSAQKKAKIVEGNSTKKLVPSPKIAKIAEVVNIPDEQPAVSKVPEIQTETKMLETEPATNESNTTKVLAEDEIAKNDITKTTERKVDVSQDKRTIDTQKSKVADTKEVQKTKESVPTPKPKAKYIMSSSLNDFKWIMGDWREVAGGNSSWSLSADDLLRNEDLKISLVGDKVFLDVPFEDFEGRYTLVSKSNGQFTFVRKGVVITIKKNGKGFDVVLNDHGFEQVTMRSYMK